MIPGQNETDPDIWEARIVLEKVIKQLGEWKDIMNMFVDNIPDGNRNAADRIF